MCVSNQTCQDGWTWAKFFFGVVFEFALFASGKNNATVWPVLKVSATLQDRPRADRCRVTSEGVNFILVIFHCNELFSPHYHRTIRF